MIYGNGENSVANLSIGVKRVCTLLWDWESWDKYAQTRHNMGFGQLISSPMTLMLISQKLNLSRLLENVESAHRKCFLLSHRHT